MRARQTALSTAEAAIGRDCFISPPVRHKVLNIENLPIARITRVKLNSLTGEYSVTCEKAVSKVRVHLVRAW